MEHGLRTLHDRRTRPNRDLLGSSRNQPHLNTWGVYPINPSSHVIVVAPRAPPCASEGASTSWPSSAMSAGTASPTRWPKSTGPRPPRDQIPIPTTCHASSHPLAPYLAQWSRYVPRTTIDGSASPRWSCPQGRPRALPLAFDEAHGPIPHRHGHRCCTGPWSRSATGRARRAGPPHDVRPRVA